MRYFVKMGVVGKCSQPLTVIDSLHLGEAGFYTIEFGAVPYIQNLPDLKLIVAVFHVVFVRVHVELVHENS